MARYIDAEKLSPFDNSTMGFFQIVNAPTEDVRPVVRGKWIIEDKEYGRIWHCHCSNCKKDPQDYVGGTENWWLVRLPDYCPNCGADMREVEE